MTARGGRGGKDGVLVGCSPGDGSASSSASVASSVAGWLTAASPGGCVVGDTPVGLMPGSVLWPSGVACEAAGSSGGRLSHHTAAAPSPTTTTSANKPISSPRQERDRGLAVAAGWAARAWPHWMQKRACSRLDCPHRGQIIGEPFIGLSLELRPFIGQGHRLQQKYPRQQQTHPASHHRHPILRRRLFPRVPEPRPLHRKLWGDE